MFSVRAERRAGAVQPGAPHPRVLSACGAGYRCDGNGVKAVAATAVLLFVLSLPP